MLSEMIVGVLIGPEIGPTLGGALTGSEPLTVYHISAPAVSQPTLNWAALSPKITGLPVLKMNRAWMIALLGRPISKLIVLTVTSGCGVIMEGGTWLGNSPS